MTAKTDAERPADQKPRWVFIAKLFFLAILAVLIFLLGQSMVRHRFFRGGRINQHGRLMP
jgi:hypothetical protein